MPRQPSINQVGILGQITKIDHKPGNVFEWVIEVDVYKEYADNEVEAHLTCGTSKSDTKIMRLAHVGDWVAIQGKIRTGGFIQVRSMSVVIVKPIEEE